MRYRRFDALFGGLYRAAGKVIRDRRINPKMRLRTKLPSEGRGG